MTDISVSPTGTINHESDYRARKSRGRWSAAKAERGNDRRGTKQTLSREGVLCNLQEFTDTCTLVIGI